ncbi:MAG: DUF427 domain-containing protein [Acidimicrobiales bacterium]|nr:DUF427 domain-containing protein [Acidimicrobiales bacterium]
MRAIHNGEVVAESDETIVVEGNHYFPPSSIRREAFTPTDHSTHCPWKGDAAYYTVTAAGVSAENAAWYYPEPKDKAAQIKDYVAFYGSKVDVTE